MTNGSHQKFDFDTYFDADGNVLSAPAADAQTLTDIELDAIRSAAFAEGQAQGLDEANRRSAATLDRLAASLQDAAAAQAEALDQQRRGFAEVAFAMAAYLSGEVNRRWPEETVLDLISEALSCLDPGQIMTVTVPQPTDDASDLGPGLQERLQDPIKSLVHIETSAALSPGDCHIAWNTGGLVEAYEVKRDKIVTLIDQFVGGNTPAPAPTAEGHGTDV
ncbi:MAG: hypothetical protein AAGF19_07200 [Pseudomonadota bacterium]